MKNILFSLSVLLFCGACSAQKTAKRASMTPPVLIYKTKQNYNNLVPVLLSDDKTEIMSYPAPSDVFYQGKLAVPTQLKKGYLLDNRGIGLQVAFLKLTYQEYAKLGKVLPLDTLYALIIEKDPLLELYDCGRRSSFKKPITELNRAISQGKLSKYRKLK